MKRSHHAVMKGEESKRRKHDISHHTVTEVLAQIHASEFEADMSEPESRTRESSPKQSSSPLIPHNYYHIRNTEKYSSRKLRNKAYTYTVKFKDFKSEIPLEKSGRFITGLWDYLLTTLKRKCQAKEDDHLRLYIHHDNFKSPVWIELSSPAELTPFKVIDIGLNQNKLIMAGLSRNEPVEPGLNRLEPI